MSVLSVHWHEGMFLWPQQMQQAERFYAHQVHLNGKWDTHYYWGLRSLTVDLDALANSRFSIRDLQARLPDGTLVAVPGNMTLDVKAALAAHPSVTIFLALPELGQGKPNVAERAAASGANPPPAPETTPSKGTPSESRYLVESLPLEDENLGADSQPIQVRSLNLKLLWSVQKQAKDHPGYTVLPLARVRRAAQPEGQPDLDVSYIPPLLACAAWKPLCDGVLQVIYDRMGRVVEKLAAQVVTRRISFDTRNPGDSIVLAQLHSLNEGYGYFKALAFAKGIHPLKAYLELCRLAGKLAVFYQPNPRAPTLPPYDHDDLGGCFYKVKQYLDSIQFAEPIYEERPFVGVEKRMQVSLEPKWLEPMWEMFVGVESSLKTEDCVRLWTKSGQMDIKIGSSTRVDELFARGLKGLDFTHSPAPPRALPARPDLVVFQVSREAQQAEWQYVQQSKTLAIRFKQQGDGNIHGQQKLSIKMGNQTTTMQLSLYLVPREIKE
jgi:type VI secretion system protein ImpJ